MNLSAILTDYLKILSRSWGTAVVSTRNNRCGHQQAPLETWICQSSAEKIELPRVTGTPENEVHT